MEVEERYIGLYSAEERKRLFIEYFGRDAPTMRGEQPWLQDPYDATSWPGPLQLQAMRALPHDDSPLWDDFQERYVLQRQLQQAHATSTRPQLWEAEGRADYLGRVLNGHPELFIKAAPLFDRQGDIDPEKVAEVYNEIKVGYALNELVFGYSQVLSLHFMTVVDWFMAAEVELPPLYGTQVPRARHHQLVVLERADMTLERFLLQHPHIDVLRATLFQTYHAMEIGWATLQLTHNDLHLHNIMVQRIDAPSPIAGRHLVYQRLAQPNWHVLWRDHLLGHLVKVIDFGRCRAMVASQEEHTHPETRRHTHDTLVALPWGENLGYPTDRANRQIDLNRLLLNILALPNTYWNAVGNDEADEFFALCDAVLDFAAINALITFSPRAELRHEQRVAARGHIRASSLRHCHQVLRHLMTPGIFVYSFTARGRNCSDVLDHAFFDIYRTPTLVDRATGEEAIAADFAVVSFLQQPGEAVLSLAAAQSQQSARCSCGLASTAQAVEGDVTRRYCGRVCFEFQHLFGGRTVMR